MLSEISENNISNHIFVAWRRYSENPLEHTIIILADDTKEAQILANLYFGISALNDNTFVCVHEIIKTEHENVFNIK